MTGSARLTQEAKEDREQLLRQQEFRHKQFGLQRKRKALEAQIELLRSEFESEESEVLKGIENDKARNERFIQDQKKMADSRKADVTIKKTGTNKKKKNM